MVAVLNGGYPFQSRFRAGTIKTPLHRQKRLAIGWNEEQGALNSARKIKKVGVLRDQSPVNLAVAQQLLETGSPRQKFLMWCAFVPVCKLDDQDPLSGPFPFSTRSTGIFVFSCHNDTIISDIIGWRKGLKMVSQMCCNYYIGYE